MLIGALYSGGHVENDEIFPGSDHTFEGKRAFGEIKFMYKRYDTFKNEEKLIIFLYLLYLLNIFSVKL